MTRARHSQEMRVALAEGCSLAEARRKLAALRHAATLAARYKMRGDEGASFIGLDVASQPSRSVETQVSIGDGGKPTYWWKEHD
jgi:hypothetical protein